MKLSIPTLRYVELPIAGLHYGSGGLGPWWSIFAYVTERNHYRPSRAVAFYVLWNDRAAHVVLVLAGHGGRCRAAR
jgi:hypothetical protein